MCAKVKVIVNDLKKTQGEKVAFQNILVGSGTSAKEIKKAKLKSHGVIANDKDGKLVQTLDGHAFGKKELEAVVAKLLKK